MRLSIRRTSSSGRSSLLFAGSGLNWLSDPFGEPETAFLASMDINASSFLRAACELVTGYTPVGQGNNYTHVVVLTGSGT